MLIDSKLKGATTSQGPATRRNVLTLLLGTWGVGVVGAVLYPILRFLAPPDIPEATTLTASAGKASDLAPNTGRVVPFGSGPALVVRTASGELRAFTAVCTHLSCTVQYRSDLQEIWCACHNGHYDLNGRNIAGPPPKPLRAYDVNVKGDEIIVSRNA
jgi:cytochrome b6-f complex iron-sulfur subunit